MAKDELTLGKAGDYIFLQGYQLRIEAVQDDGWVYFVRTDPQAQDYQETRAWLENSKRVGMWQSATGFWWGREFRIAALREAGEVLRAKLELRQGDEVERAA